MTILTGSSFGLYEIIGLVLACFMIGILVMEIKAKKSGDLFSNITIAVIGVGVSLYTFYKNFEGSEDTGKFNFSNLTSEPTTWIYLVVLLATIGFIVFFLRNHYKYKDQIEETKEETSQLEENLEPLSDEQIEEILEKENNESKENTELLKETNDKENSKVEKEGASQVPKEQRNPFEK